MRCRDCDAQTPEGARFCEDCGATLLLSCPSCGAEATPGKRFCRECGAQLLTDVLQPEDAGDGEHKLVTVLFCDVVGSTGIAERIGAEAMHELLSRFSDLASDEIRRFGGTVTTFMGDAGSSPWELISLPSTPETRLNIPYRPRWSRRLPQLGEKP